MFIQYCKNGTPFSPVSRISDPRLQILFPSEGHCVFAPGQDFYVIGAFQNLSVRADAVFTVTLRELAGGRTVRRVAAAKKDDRAGIRTDAENLLTENSEEEIRKCGMPDLVFDPRNPDSYWDSWRKAYFTDRFFSALLYGGCFARDRISPFNADGSRLEPLAAGEYELSVTLENGGETICSTRTLRLGDPAREKILSRFSPEAHYAAVRRFAARHGFQEYTAPFAGIWDTACFPAPWPQAVKIEDSDRWHFGDAQEYASGRVYFFDYHISAPCVSYAVELGSMLAADRNCTERPERLTVLYYDRGDPIVSTEDGDLTGAWKEFPTDRKFLVTRIERSEARSEDGVAREDLLRNLRAEFGSALTCRRGETLTVAGVCRPIPSSVRPTSAFGYEIENRVCAVRYAFYADEASSPVRTEEKPTGIVRRSSAADPGGASVLEFRHCFRLPPAERSVRIVLTALDCAGAELDTDVISVRLCEETT